tara:strand:- start:271 stop:561 length:291 start_codon:yes stop_codon:yes gene_type:complete
MIFHVYHFHNELTCPINDTDLFLSSFGSVVDSLEANNVTVIGAWIDGPGHKSFYIIDAESADDIHNGLHPIIARGTAVITPVSDLQERSREVAEGQ